MLAKDWEYTRMWSINTLTERLNLKWPILQAPMGSASTPALAAAVTNAGGLGGLGMWGRSAIRPHAASRGFGSKAAGVSTSITRFGPTRAAHLTPAGRCGNIYRSNTTPSVWAECQNRRAK